MCTGVEPALIGAAVAAAGAGVQMHEQGRTLRNQDRSAADAIINQGAKNAKGTKAVQDNIKQLQGSNQEGDVASRVAAYTDAIKRAQPQAQGGLNAVAGGSRKYAEDVGQAKTDATALALDRGATQARVDAPVLQRTRETQNANNTATNLNMISADAQAQAFLDKLKLQSIRNNPWLMAAGKTLQGAGSAYAMGGTGAGAGGGTGSGMFSDGGLVSSGVRYA